MPRGVQLVHPPAMLLRQLPLQEHEPEPEPERQGSAGITMQR